MNTILICDDDKDIVSALKKYLTSEGYNTVEASRPAGLRRRAEQPGSGHRRGGEGAGAQRAFQGGADHQCAADAPN